MVGDRDQAARCQYVEILARPGRFQSAGEGGDQALAFDIGADRRIKRAGQAGDGAVERQFAKYA